MQIVIGLIFVSKSMSNFLLQLNEMIECDTLSFQFIESILISKDVVWWSEYEIILPHISFVIVRFPWFSEESFDPKISNVVYRHTMLREDRTVSVILDVDWSTYSIVPVVDRSVLAIQLNQPKRNQCVNEENEKSIQMLLQFDGSLLLHPVVLDWLNPRQSLDVYYVMYAVVFVRFASLDGESKFEYVSTPNNSFFVLCSCVQCVDHHHHH